MFILFFFFFRTWWGKLFLQSRPQTEDVSPSHFGVIDLVQLEGRLKTFHLGGLVILQRRRHSLGEQGFRWHWIVVILPFLTASVELHRLSLVPDWRGVSKWAQSLCHRAATFCPINTLRQQQHLAHQSSRHPRHHSSWGDVSPRRQMRNTSGVTNVTFEKSYRRTFSSLTPIAIVCRVGKVSGVSAASLDSQSLGPRWPMSPEAPISG